MYFLSLIEPVEKAVNTANIIPQSVGLNYLIGILIVGVLLIGTKIIFSE